MGDDRDDWLAWRRQGIGGSDIAAILGISPWASPWSVWADKVGLLPPTPEDEYMAAGRWLERAIGPWFEDRTGLVMRGEQTQCEHPERPTHRCTVDGFAFEAQGVPIARTFDIDRALGSVEIKVTGPGKAWDEIPAHIQAQGQWQMHVTGRGHTWFPVLMGRRLDIHELDRDQDDIDYMVERADEFWQQHVVTGDPPPTDGHDATDRALAAVYAHASPGAVALGSDVMGHIHAWRFAKAVEKTAKGDAQTAANAIKAALGEATEGTWLGQRVVSWRPQTRKTTCGHCHVVDESDPFRVLRHHPLKETR